MNSPHDGGPARAGALRRRWSDLAAELGWPDAAGAVGDDLLSRYAEPHRRYHTPTHLEHVLAVLDDLVAPGAPSPAVRLAAWFHDAVYDPARPDNEARSADLATAQLAGLGADDTLTGQVADLVRATADHQVPAGLDEAGLLLDADLSVLGSDPATYDRYVVAVRAEYAEVDDAAWAAGRGALLRSFLERPHLFHTEAGRARFEAAAHANLARELAALRQG